MSSIASIILWNTVWSALFALLVFVLGKLPALQRRPALMHLLWFSVFLRMIVPTIIRLPILPNLPTTASSVSVQTEFAQVVPQAVRTQTVSTTMASQSGPTIARETVSRVEWPTPSMILITGSLTGTFALLLLCIVRGRRLALMQRKACDAPKHLRDRTESLSRDMQLKVVPQVRLVQRLATPAVCGGWRRCTILLPRHLIEVFDDDQWSCILAHELAHVVRGDLGFNFVAATILHLFWWNPIAWWAWREMRACQEASCDAIALSRESHSRRLYATTLLQVVESLDLHPLVQPHVLLGFGNRSVLTWRFKMISNPSVRPRTTFIATLCLAVLVMSFFCLPVRADKESSIVELEMQLERIKKLLPEVEQLLKQARLKAAADDSQKTSTPLQVKEELTGLSKESASHIKQILLALHNYHNQHGSFPPPVLYGKDNKGGEHSHSWRVALLPYLDQVKLYESYHFDEAWNSAANIEVLAKMPEVYRAPGETPTDFHSAYVVFVGQMLDDDKKLPTLQKLQTLFSSKSGVRIRDIYDGTSNTLAVIETKMDGKHAIPWTEPKDLSYDPAAELPKLGGVCKGGFWIGTADGAAHFLADTVKESTIRELISPCSGGVLEGFHGSHKVEF
jgi:beta-lactamase regulating signal transducer with metallopeptidase domain